MSQNPLNLALRFALELVAVAGWIVLGTTLAERAGGVVLAASLAGAAMLLWGVFRTPDPAGHFDKPAAVVPVPGWVRLLIEALVLGGGVAGLFAGGYRAFGLVVIALLVAHYALSYDRLVWLLRPAHAAQS